MCIDQAGQRHVSARSGQSATGCTLDATRTLDLFNPKTFASIKAVLPLSLFSPFSFDFPCYIGILLRSYTPTSKWLFEGALNCTWGCLVSVRSVLWDCICCTVCDVTVFVVLSVTSLSLLYCLWRHCLCCTVCDVSAFVVLSVTSLPLLYCLWRHCLCCTVCDVTVHDHVDCRMSKAL
jgi:hypothetical protein